MPGGCLNAPVGCRRHPPQGIVVSAERKIGGVCRRRCRHTAAAAPTAGACCPTVALALCSPPAHQPPPPHPPHTPSSMEQRTSRPSLSMMWAGRRGRAPSPWIARSSKGPGWRAEAVTRRAQRPPPTPTPTAAPRRRAFARCPAFFRLLPDPCATVQRQRPEPEGHLPAEGRRFHTGGGLRSVVHVRFL